MQSFYDFVYGLFAGKSITDQVTMLIICGIVLMVAEIIITRLIKWIKRKLK